MSAQLDKMRPVKVISLDNFLYKAEEEKCHVRKEQKQLFIGGDFNKLTYPHIHVWQNGIIALSVGPGINQKIGKDEEISIDLLEVACSRYTLPSCSLNNVIRWVFCSAS